MAYEGQVIHVHSDEEWTNLFQKGVESKKLVVVDFTASWCGPCRLIAPLLAEIAEKTTQATFLKADIDELENVAKEHKIQSVPTFLFFKDGKEVDKIVGAKKGDLQLKVIEHAGVLNA